MDQVTVFERYDMSRPSPIDTDPQIVDCVSDTIGVMADLMSRRLRARKLVTDEFDGNLTHLHRFVADSSVLNPSMPLRDQINNELRMLFTTSVFRYFYLTMVSRICDEVLGGDYVFERKPSFRVVFPRSVPEKYRTDYGVSLTHHSDILLGDPTGGVNCWIPFTSNTGTASLFLCDREVSIRVLGEFMREYGEIDAMRSRTDFFDFLVRHKDIVEQLEAVRRPAEVPLGTGMLFDVRRIHGTGDNQLDQTRVSMDFRLLPRGSYQKLAHKGDIAGRGMLDDAPDNRILSYDDLTSGSLHEELGQIGAMLGMSELRAQR